jgi:hypothetical protein
VPALPPRAMRPLPVVSSINASADSNVAADLHPCGVARQIDCHASFLVGHDLAEGRPLLNQNVVGCRGHIISFAENPATRSSRSQPRWPAQGLNRRCVGIIQTGSRTKRPRSPRWQVCQGGHVQRSTRCWSKGHSRHPLHHRHQPRQLLRRQLRDPRNVASVKCSGEVGSAIGR